MSKDPEDENSEGPFKKQAAAARGESWGVEGTMASKDAESPCELARQ